MFLCGRLAIIVRIVKVSGLMFAEGPIFVPRNFVLNHLQPGFQKKPTTLKPYTPCGYHKHGCVTLLGLYSFVLLFTLGWM